MPGDARLFQESITQELDAIKNRVRHLIGNAHWGEEGRFKEAVLKNVIRKFLPSNLSVGTGFILRAEGDSDDQNELSSQLDVIIYDNTLPLLFSEGDFIITTANNIRAIIEVKSRITHNTFAQVVKQFDNSITPFIPLFIAREQKVFTGIFAFNFEGNIQSPTVEASLRNSSAIINHISLGPDLFIKKWNQTDGLGLAIPVNCQSDFYNFYALNNLSFSYFISNLIDITSGGLDDRYWFSYPIHGTKEINRVKSVCL